MMLRTIRFKTIGALALVVLVGGCEAIVEEEQAQLVPGPCVDAVECGEDGVIRVVGQPVPGTLDGEELARERFVPANDESGCEGINDSDCTIDRDGDGWVARYDCAEADAAINPRAAELRCDGTDQNCDGVDDCDSDLDGVLDPDDCAPDDSTMGIECRLPEDWMPPTLL